MIDAQTQAILTAILRRESLSLLQYVGESFPWITIDERPALARLNQIIAEDKDGVGDLVRFLTRKRLMPPYIGSYPSSFTSYGFVSMDFLVPRLVEEQRGEIAALERDIIGVTDAEARAQVQQVLDLKRRHLPELEKMAAEHPVPAGR
jgi:hypothetical protein